MMLKGVLSAMSRVLDFKYVRKRAVEFGNGFEIYRYCNAGGTFDYDKYKRTQIDGNQRKLEKIWAVDENIGFLASYINSNMRNVDFGICHGTRRGKEQEWFRKYLDCDVIGTEISPTATQFPNTIEWDFHDVKPEWMDAVDFIYSNSFDHSYNPEECLNAWMSCVRKGGICVLEHTSGHESATRLDPFGAHISVMPYLILNWGKGKYYVREILDAPSRIDTLTYVRFIIIQRL